LASLLKEHHILVIAMTPALVRFVLHLDITDEMLATTIDTIEKL
jgi:threonine aldolase